MNTTRLDTPSEYFVDSVILISDVTGTELNITNIYDSITINEKISSPFMYGIISITDTNGFIESVPIIGEERIQFKLKKKIGDERYFEVKAFVYKISNRMKNKESKSIEYYNLCFITENALINQTKRVSKTYDGTVSSMVEKISKDFLNLEKIENVNEKKPKPYDTILIETTSDNNKITIPNMKPTDSIDFLSRFSYSGSGKDKNPYNTTFFFYQTRQGYFYQSIESIITKNASKKRKQFLISNDVNIKNADIDKSDLFTVIEYRFVNLYDNLKASHKGYYGGTNVGFDTLTKTIHNHQLNYGEIFDDMIHLDKNNTNTNEYVFNKYPDKMLFTSLPTRRGSSESVYISTKKTEDVYYTKEEQIKLLKNTKRNRFNDGIVVEIEIPSNPYLYVNEIVNLRFPSFKRENGEKNFFDDKYFSGDYIVIGIRHELSDIQNKIWSMTVTLLKDSYKSKIEKKK